MGNITRRVRLASVCAATALGLLACGGGNDALPPKTSIGQVSVMGDSLADVGTFGYKFTVQDAANTGGFPVWPQLVATAFGLNGSAQCPGFVYGSNGFAPNPDTTCRNYAIGGSRILAGVSRGGASSPLNVNVQMAARAAKGPYAGTELVLIDGGGNDAADLVGAYLGASSAQGQQNYQAFLAQQLDSATLSALLPQAQGAERAAGAYMQALADTFAAQIQAQVLGQGAAHVAVLDIPDITLTPRLQAVLAGVAARSNAATAQAVQTAIQNWIGAYNSRLRSHFEGDARVAVVPFYADFSDEIKHPENYQLSNTSAAVCPSNGLGSDGLPSYSFPDCTSGFLNALPGHSVGWWQAYAFSDGFHPTPYGHRLLAASVSRALARTGWL